MLARVLSVDKINKEEENRWKELGRRDGRRKVLEIVLLIYLGEKNKDGKCFRLVNRTQVADITNEIW